MKLLHRVTGLLVFMELLVLGLLAFSTAILGDWWAFTTGEFLADFPGVGLWGGLATISLAFLFVLTGIPPRHADRSLTFDNDQGAVSISTTAIADYISALAEEFPAVTRMIPRVVPLRRSVDIVVDVRVKTGAPVHEICQLLQRRIRETMTEGLGIKEVHHIQINVPDIVTVHRPR